MVSGIQPGGSGYAVTLTNRRYTSKLRTDAAQATRRKILLAARRLFSSSGYQPTTIEAIARRAGVSVPTVYAVFQSKAGILSALVASAGADEDIRLAARRAMTESEPRRRLAAAAHVIRMILERERDLLDLLWQAGSGNAQLRKAWRQSHEQQLRRQTEIFAPAAVVGRLKPGLSRQAAAETFWVLSSPEVYRLLVIERSWTPTRYEKWLAAAGVRLLLAD